VRRSITASDIEYEVDFPGASAVMRLHQRCLAIWDQQRNDFPSNVARAAEQGARGR
jgi:hypothetical protein